MNNPVVRSVAAVLAGVVTAIIVVALFEIVGHSLFLPPPGFDVTDPADQARLMEVIPPGAIAAVWIAWFAGSLAGACVAMTIARRVLPGWTVGLIVALLGLWSTQMFPHPPWMVVAALVLPLVAVLVAKRLMASKLAVQAL